MNSFGADFLLRFRPFQSSFLPFNPPYISNKGFNSDVVPARWNAGDIEQTLCRFLDSYAEKDNGENGRKGNVKADWREKTLRFRMSDNQRNCCPEKGPRKIFRDLWKRNERVTKDDSYSETDG
jgi:hypothetical protein